MSRPVAEERSSPALTFRVLGNPRDPEGAEVHVLSELGRDDVAGALDRAFRRPFELQAKVDQLERRINELLKKR